MGDWDGDGVVTIGGVDGLGNWYLRNTNSTGGFDIGPIPYGLPFWTPVSGRYPPPAQALRAEGSAPAGRTGSDLTDAALQGVVAAALDRLASADVNETVRTHLREAQYTVGTVPAGDLALTDGNRVLFSPDAAGHGWFLDPTPTADEEFTPGSPVRRLRGGKTC